MTQRITDLNQLANLLDLDLDMAVESPSSAKLGFYGATPIVKPGGYTQTYSATDKTVLDPTVNLGGADYGADFNALASNLRLIVKNLNAVIDDLQALGLLS